MAYEDDGNAALFGEPEKHCSHFLYLADASGGGFDGFGEHCLNRINNHQLRLDRLRLLQNRFHPRLGENGCILHLGSEPVRTHFHLTRTLLAGNIQGLQPRNQRNLQTQRRLAYTRLAADKHQRTRHDAASEKTVQLGHAELQSRLFGTVYLLKLQRLPLASSATSHPLRALPRRLLLYRSLNHRVPLSARRAPPHPLGTLVAAVGAVP